MSVPGVATSEHTQSFFSHAPSAAVRLPGQSIWVSRNGVRCTGYLPHFTETATRLLKHKINVWEFAPAWSEGEAEFQFGQLLVTGTVSGTLQRSSLFLIERLGGIDAETRHWLEVRKLQKRPITEIYTDESGHAYSIHPRVLETQLSHSLARLQVDSLDFVVLENPPLLVESPIPSHWHPAFLKLETLAREEMLSGFGVVLPVTSTHIPAQWISAFLDIQETVCLKLNMDISESAFRGIILQGPATESFLDQTITLWGQRLSVRDAFQRLNWIVFVEPVPPELPELEFRNPNFTEFPQLLPIEWWGSFLNTQSSPNR